MYIFGDYFGSGNGIWTAMNLVQMVVLDPGTYYLTFRVWGSS